MAKNNTCQWLCINFFFHSLGFKTQGLTKKWHLKIFILKCHKTIRPAQTGPEKRQKFICFQCLWTSAVKMRGPAWTGPRWSKATSKNLWCFSKSVDNIFAWSSKTINLAWSCFLTRERFHIHDVAGKILLWMVGFHWLSSEKYTEEPYGNQKQCYFQPKLMEANDKWFRCCCCNPS
jgi:hypothetical protein